MNRSPQQVTGGRGPSPSGSATHQVFIVDDHPIVRRGLADLIDDEPDLVVCGQAADAREAMERIRANPPDIVVCDLTLEGVHGLELIKRIIALGSDIKVLVSSMHEESVYAERVLHAGGLGYVNKQETVEKLIDAIHAVLSGKVFLSDKMQARLLRRSVGSLPPVAGSPVEVLSDRELEVFRLIGEGHTTRQVADRLHVSVKTIESHRENIKTKLSLTNAAELTRRAVEFVLQES